MKHVIIGNGPAGGVATEPAPIPQAGAATTHAFESIRDRVERVYTGAKSIRLMVQASPTTGC